MLNFPEVLRDITLLFFAGYLAVSLFLNESHELLLLLVNTVLKVDIFFFSFFCANICPVILGGKVNLNCCFQDLQSTNLIEVCMALTVVSQIFPKDMIPAILPLVEEKLNNPK